MRHMALLAAAVMMASHAVGQETNRNESARPEPPSQPVPQTNCPVMDGKRSNTRLYVDNEGYRIYVCCVLCLKAVRKNHGKYQRKLLDQGIDVEKVKQLYGDGEQRERVRKTRQGTERQTRQD